MNSHLFARKDFQSNSKNVSKDESIKINLAPKYEKEPLSDILKVPKSIINEIFDFLVFNKFIPNLKKYNSKELFVIDLLGNDPLEWSFIIQTKFKNEILGRKVFKTFCPVLSKNCHWLEMWQIYDAIILYEDVAEYSFSFFGPFEAGTNFEKWLKEQQTKSHSKTIDKTKRNLGFIINTSKGEGSHWVAMFVKINYDYKKDCSDIYCEFFDPIGNTPNKDVKETIDSILDVICKEFNCRKDWKREVWYTDVRKQMLNTECAVYCVWFIVHKLETNNDLEKIDQIHLPDHVVRKYRNVFWNYR